MSPREVTEFTEEHVAAAAEVLSRRHRRHLARVPTLPEVPSYASQVETALSEATGSVAIDGGRVVGYLLGKRAQDDVGPHVWSHLAGHAADDPDCVRDLYAHAARRWVDDGLLRHFVFVPALDELVAPWFKLSFGASAAMAARPAANIPSWSAPGVVVREVGSSDYRAVARLEHQLYSELLESPSFSGIHVDTVEEFEAERWELGDDERYVSFLAELDDEVVGQLFLYRRPEGDLRVPQRSIDLASATTEPTHRGRGVATAMTWTAMRWARDHGVDTVITDWRMTNLAAARFWPARGFEETFLRLYRSIP